LRELLRGAAAHGTCGVGVGETVGHGLKYPEQQLRYAHLLSRDENSRTLVDRLHAVRETLLAEFLPQCPEKDVGAWNSEFEILQNETLVEKWLASARALARQCPPAPFETIRSQLRQAGCVLFESAQGALLDEWRGAADESNVCAPAVNGKARRNTPGSRPKEQIRRSKGNPLQRTQNLCGLATQTTRYPPRNHAKTTLPNHPANDQ